jgi:hypothetical protein
MLSVLAAQPIRHDSGPVLGREVSLARAPNVVRHPPAGAYTGDLFN